MFPIDCMLSPRTAPSGKNSAQARSVQAESIDSPYTVNVIVNDSMDVDAEMALSAQRSEAARILKGLATAKGRERKKELTELRVVVGELRIRLDEQRKVFELLGMALPAQVKQAAAKD